MCKVKISRLEYLGGQAGPCWQPQPWERKNKYNYQFQTTTWKRMRLLSFDSFFCLIFFLFLSSSFLFSDSSHLCFSICPYCRKFDSETSLDYTFAYMYWTVLIFIFRINDPGMSTQLRRIIGWTEQCDWYLWLLGSAVLLFIFLIIIWVFHILRAPQSGSEEPSWGVEENLSTDLEICSKVVHVINRMWTLLWLTVSSVYICIQICGEMASYLFALISLIEDPMFVG